MGFGRDKTPAVALTREQTIARYWQIAESEFASACEQHKGTVEGRTLHASIASAATALATGLAAGAFAPSNALDSNTLID